jgi:hypothetical protein
MYLWCNVWDEVYVSYFNDINKVKISKIIIEKNETYIVIDELIHWTNQINYKCVFPSDRLAKKYLREFKEILIEKMIKS